LSRASEESVVFCECSGRDMCETRWTLSLSRSATIRRYKVDFQNFTSVDDGESDEFYDSDDSGKWRGMCFNLARP
jgi:hypothetical protein